MNPTCKVFFIAFAIVVLTTFAFAQGAATGDLHVTVRDQKGGAVTNATVTAREQAKGFERSTTENVDGEYPLLALPPGKYTVSVSAPGFADVDAKNQDVTVGQMRDLPITLLVAGTQETVTVNSQTELVETQRSSSTDTIEQRRIDNLPINGRNYINFALTDSRLARDDAPSIGAAPTSGLNMSGQRARANLVNVDGADAVDNSVNGIRSTVSQEAVQEFQIITNGYAAEYGRASGGVVNIITRSGANDFHGSLFGYVRNRNFQAVNPFSTVRRLAGPSRRIRLSSISLTKELGGRKPASPALGLITFNLCHSMYQLTSGLPQERFQFKPPPSRQPFWPARRRSLC